MQEAFLFLVGVLSVLGVIVLIRLASRVHCAYCYHPTHRCECPVKCRHDDTHPRVWTQDGYVAKCRQCGEIVYLGDD